MRNVRCADCDEYRNEWCEKKTDSPDPDVIRDCQYFHEADKDVIKVIRCKDCKHRPTLTDEGITFGFSVAFPDEICPCQCEDGWYNWYPKNDFYCGFAERREE